MSKIYQDTEGSYHDLTAANLAEWAPADESLLTQPLQTVEDLRAEGGDGGEPDGNPGGDTTLVSTPGPEVQTEGSRADEDAAKADAEAAGVDALNQPAAEPATAKAKTRQQ